MAGQLIGRDRYRRVLGGIALAISALASSSVMAHPHGWIDLQVRAMTNESGQLVGLQQAWLMDPFYSLVVMEELQSVEGASLEEGLDQLGHDITANLSRQHYMTHVSLDGEPLALGEVSEYTTRIVDDRVSYRFNLPLAEPQTLSGHTLSYQVYDPTYYIEVVHAEQENADDDPPLVLRGHSACRISVLPADPDPDKVMEAAQLDQNEQSEPGLGRFFAETGRINCRER